MGWIRGLAPTKLAIREPQHIAVRRAETKQNVEYVEEANGDSKDDCGAQQ